MAGIKEIITGFLRIANHKIADGYGNYLCGLVDEELKNDLDGNKGNEYLDPFDRVRFYLPNPLDATDGMHVINYLNAALVTIAYNCHEKKYGSIKNAWEGTRAAFRAYLIDSYEMITADQKAMLNIIATPEELIIMSVWNG